MPAVSKPLSAGVGLWGQDLGLGEAFADSAYATEARTEVEIYVQKCADHGVSRVFAPGASRELVEAGSAAGVEVPPLQGGRFPRRNSDAPRVVLALHGAAFRDGGRGETP